MNLRTTQNARRAATLFDKDKALARIEAVLAVRVQHLDLRAGIEAREETLEEALFYAVMEAAKEITK